MENNLYLKINKKRMYFVRAKHIQQISRIKHDIYKKLTLIIINHHV